MTDIPAEQTPEKALGRNSLLSPEDNRRMFNRIARWYDFMNSLLSLRQDVRWRRKAVAELDPVHGARYLDMGCGTGDMAIEIVRQCPRATVVGIDPAEEMLSLARRKTRRASLERALSFQVGDGMHIEFPNGSFAGAVCAFCIRNITDRLRAMAEMKRVLARGSRLVVLELTTPANPVLHFGHKVYSRCIIPTAGRLIARSGQAYRYLVDSVETLPRVEKLAGMMTQAGFEDVRCVSLLGGSATVFVGQVR
ncbi:MAG: ubiquinone/menaquinone biosynthesis methyltransferase [Phycisphaerae bacterium]|nr:ubiquinone/menaquinone biosynthesis methyltransferase [Phycisphaerae bacterium]